MNERIHFIGIGGAGMSGLARILARQGAVVTGSDLLESPTLASMRTEGITAVVGHDADNIGAATLVVFSAAVKEDNPELIAARERGVFVVTRAEMLGRVMSRYPRSVAITGTHGKTTTTGMVAMVLDAAGLDPTVLIGGDLPAYGGNARLGGGDVFVAEACEAYDSFLQMKPAIAVVTNIEADHLDYYGDLSNILRSFRKFLEQTTEKAILCGYDLNIRAPLEDPEGFPPYIRYGSRAGVDVRARDILLDSAEPSYTAYSGDTELGRIVLSVPGMHNVANSLAAVAVGLEFGVPFERIAAGLASFTGTGRRFERLGETANGVTVIDDYAHHPTEIRATLRAAHKVFGGERRVIAVFQPHLPSRTSDFMEGFAESFGDADHVFLTDIYLARERPREGVTGASLAALTARRRGAAYITYVSDMAAIPTRLASFTAPGDVVLTMGAGHDVRIIAEEFLRMPMQEIL
jgi:UDP-N-acetylmuramate--alanine ligase